MTESLHPDVAVAPKHMASRLAALKLEAGSRAYQELGARGQEVWLSEYCTGTKILEFMKSRVYYYTGELERPAGMIGVECRDGCAYITDLYVRDERRGCGQALLSQALQWARAQNLDFAVVDLFAVSTSGRRFFEKQGFEVFENTILHSGVESVRYRKDLTN